MRQVRCDRYGAKCGATATIVLSALSSATIGWGVYALTDPCNYWWDPGCYNDWWGYAVIGHALVCSIPALVCSTIMCCQLGKAEEMISRTQRAVYPIH